MTVSQDYLNGLAVSLIGYCDFVAVKDVDGNIRHEARIEDVSRMISFATKRHACATCSVTPWSGVQDSRPPTPSPAKRLARRVDASRIEKRPQLDSHGNIIIPEGHVPFYYGGVPSGGEGIIDHGSTLTISTPF